eukprot:1516338-Rhodomonas_salina.1
MKLVNVGARGISGIQVDCEDCDGQSTDVTPPLSVRPRPRHPTLGHSNPTLCSPICVIRQIGNARPCHRAVDSDAVSSL